jgi:hypothetical protein
LPLGDIAQTQAAPTIPITPAAPQLALWAWDKASAPGMAQLAMLDIDDGLACLKPVQPSNSIR